MPKVKIALACAIASAALAVPASSHASTAEPEASASVSIVDVRSEAADRPCGRSAEPDGAGGWWLYWNNCWGYIGLPIAPMWESGGNSWVNVRNANGANLCGHVRTGEVGVWHISASDTPPAVYTRTTYCVRG
jgi:hypothetical protein